MVQGILRQIGMFQIGPHLRSRNLLVGMLSFDLEFLFTGRADPSVFTFDECVVVDTGAVIVGAQITFHIRDFSVTNRGLLLICGLSGECYNSPVYGP